MHALQQALKLDNEKHYIHNTIYCENLVLCKLHCRVVQRPIKLTQVSKNFGFQFCNFLVRCSVYIVCSSVLSCNNLKI